MTARYIQNPKQQRITLIHKQLAQAVKKATKQIVVVHYLS